MVECSECRREVHPLDVFPLGRCLECHAVAHENDTPEEMYRQIVGTFGRQK